MKSKPILFSAPMICAILEGRKTQTRRVMKRKFPFGEIEPNVTSLGGCPVHFPDGSWENEWCPYGWQGSRLWVRETFQWVDMGDDSGYVYRATDPDWQTTEGWTWKPSIFMPRAASRITLEITNIRCERLHDISEQDAILEGVEPLFSQTEINTPRYRHELDLKPMPYKNYLYPKDSYYSSCKTARQSFRSLWQKINKLESWMSNPWVWVIEFKVLEPCR